jgi:hypothetical protein
MISKEMNKYMHDYPIQRVPSLSGQESGRGVALVTHPI